MRLSELKYMSDADKVKLGVASALLVIGLFMIYWFGIRTPAPVIDTSIKPAPVVAEPGGPPPAASHRVAPQKGK